MLTEEFIKLLQLLKDVTELRKGTLEAFIYAQIDALAAERVVTVYEGKAKDFGEEHTQMTKRLKNRELRLVELGMQLQNSEANADEYKEKQRQSSDQIAAVQRSYNEEVRQHHLLKEEATKRRERLMQLMSFSVKIEDLNLPVVINRTNTIWISATELIRDHFGHNLPEEILQGDWTSLLDSAADIQRISLPQSNSDTAKKIRVAVILRALARLVVKYIFQPAYLLDEDSGLRGILVEQATINPTKERYACGILLSMIPGNQETYDEETVDLVVDKLVNALNVRVLYPKAVETCTGVLKFLVTKFQDEWKIVQRGKQKIEPSFNYLASTDHPWQVFDVNIADGKDGKQHNVEATLNTNSAEGDIVILPRLYLVGPDPEPAPITHGCVLQMVLCDAAEGEVRKDVLSAPFARATSSRHQALTNRTMSISGDAALISRRGYPFLSRSCGPQDA
ncbi:hypothetical protein L13192_03824 [Pyrenophora tritici-repentis]|nr:hypothetical protein L13192_03824 [Pyrenophora tritici-repentis]